MDLVVVAAEQEDTPVSGSDIDATSIDGTVKREVFSHPTTWISRSVATPLGSTMVSNNNKSTISQPAAQIPFSRVLPGEERIHENVFVDSPIVGPSDPSATTIYEVVQRAAKLTSNGPFLGELKNGEYSWSSYNTVLYDAQVVGSALLHFGIKPGDDTRVGIAGIHSLRYMTAVHALVSYSMVLVPLYHNSRIDALCDVINQCELEVIFCDDEARAETFISKMIAGVIKAPKKLIILKTTNKQPNGAHATVPDLELYSYDYVYTLGEQHLAPIVPPSPDSTYIICFTSGTTGQPKGVVLSHRCLLAAVIGIHIQFTSPPNNLSFGKDDVYFSFLSLAHIYEHLMQTFTIYAGGRIGIYSGEVSRLLTDIQILRPTIISLVPRLLNKFHDHIHAQIAKKNVLVRKLFEYGKEAKLRMLHKGIQQYDIIWDKLVFGKMSQVLGGRVRMLTTGGAPVIPAVMDFTRIAYGCPLVEGYGQTECAAAGTLSMPCDTSNGHVGGPSPWAQVKLVDVPDLGYYSANNKGEVCFRGAAVMKGYYKDDELSSRTIDSEGWLHTGDIGEWLPNGALKIIDRKNALFKLAQGDFVSPEQIETIYLNSQLVVQIFVTGVTTRSFLVAVAVANIANLREALESRSDLIRYAELPSEKMLNESEVQRFVLQELNRTGREKGLRSIELVKSIYLISEELTPENGLVTPTLKLRRHLLKEKFSKQIERMFAEETAL
ncbi:unnamed protein product [Cylicocyclus nassatus]|uniref:long-chain-fatty-acid--CoA ligase n=1 Tax=Cylicocyclus nassatus TaxID=53992 RepID=A0AA36DNS0_CYLNA|nr:unnamed protein product [Cylicocyclus nassatus]